MQNAYVWEKLALSGEQYNEAGTIILFPIYVHSFISLLGIHTTI